MKFLNARSDREPCSQLLQAIVQAAMQTVMSGTASSRDRDSSQPCMPLPSSLGGPIVPQGPGGISGAQRVRGMGTILRLRHVPPSPVALMRVLLAASIFVPALIFAAVAWRGYCDAVAQ